MGAGVVVVGATVVLVVAGCVVVVAVVLAAFEQPAINAAIPASPLASPTARLRLITSDPRQMPPTLPPERGESI